MVIGLVDVGGGWMALVTKVSGGKGALSNETKQQPTASFANATPEGCVLNKHRRIGYDAQLKNRALRFISALRV